MLMVCATAFQHCFAPASGSSLTIVRQALAKLVHLRQREHFQACTVGASSSRTAGGRSGGGGAAAARAPANCAHPADSQYESELTRMKGARVTIGDLRRAARQVARRLGGRERRQASSRQACNVRCTCRLDVHTSPAPLGPRRRPVGGPACKSHSSLEQRDVLLLLRGPIGVQLAAICDLRCLAVQQLAAG